MEIKRDGQIVQLVLILCEKRGWTGDRASIKQELRLWREVTMLDLTSSRTARAFKTAIWSKELVYYLFILIR